MKIISIDDSRTVQLIVKNAVSTINIEVLTASSVAEGNEVLEENYKDISLILLDHNMPNRNGLSYLEELKNHEIYKKIPVIMLSSEQDKPIVRKAIELGADSYITKPFHQEDFLERIIPYLGQI